MKKTILILTLIALSIGAMAQTWMYTGAGNTTKARKATDSYIGRWSVNTTTNVVTMYDANGDTLIYYTPIVGQVDGGTLYPELADTALYFAPVIGVGNAGDTAAFALNNVIWGARWDGSHSLVITKVTGTVAGTSPDIDLALLYDTNYKDGTPTTVFSSDLTVTSTTTGNNASINSSNDTIAPGAYLWLRVDQATAKPTQLLISIYGYLE